MIMGIFNISNVNKLKEENENLRNLVENLKENISEMTKKEKSLEYQNQILSKEVDKLKKIIEENENKQLREIFFSPVNKEKDNPKQEYHIDNDELIKHLNKLKISSEIMKHINKTPNYIKNFGEDLFEEAVKLVTESKQVSTSLVQRRLRIGYARATRIIDEMEQLGIVGPKVNSEQRKVLMTYQEWLEYKDNMNKHL